jgi:electron transfer flavoprotein alpha subunit
VSHVLTLIELDGEHVAKTSLETLTLARSIASAHDGSLAATVRATSTPETTPTTTPHAIPSPALDDLRAHGVTRVHVLRHPQLDDDAAPAALAEALVQLHATLEASVLIGPGTDRGAEVMAHVGARTDLPLVANVTAVAPADAGGWDLTRVRWGGVLLEDGHLDAEVALFTAAPHQIAAELAAQPGDVEVVDATIDLDDQALHVTRVAERATLGGGISLATAPVVVSGGRGVGSAEGFAILEELAQLLGGAVGCSRVATNNGWRSHNDQVGQTGTRVAPDLYIACGISGATQHWVGCMSSKRILAINPDGEAPMVTRADYAVLGDLHEVLPAIVDEVKARRGVG